MFYLLCQLKVDDFSWPFMPILYWPLTATVALLEYLISSVSFALIDLEPQEIIADERLWAIIGIIQAAILIMVAMFIARIIKPVEGAWRIESPGIQQKMGK